MSWEQVAEIIEAIVQRDERLIARLSLDLCSFRNPPDWSFYRWDRTACRFRLVWPTRGQDWSTDLLAHKTQLELGEVLVDNRVPESAQDEEGGLQSPRRIALPLIQRSQLLGVLQGVSSGGESCGELSDSLRTKLTLVSNAWHLVELLDEKERQVFEDSLTGLYNADYLIHFLGNEVVRCGRYDRPIGIVFLDIDWFKRVNDTQGHLIGSDVLRELGGLLTDSVRDSDVVARYGGDEFVVVLTETGSRGSLDKAEKLRKRVEEHTFTKHSGVPLKVTISLGISVFPDHSSDARDLIHRADLAMYVAKQDNKNCVRLAMK